MDYMKESLKKHRDWKGKIEVVCRMPIETREDLSLAYTPGVAQPCLEIQKDINESYNLTRRSNLVAVITDGTAVLGLGDIGPEAGMPVMEGKCALFKTFGDVDAIPICVKSKDVDEIVKTVKLISGSFGGVNLDDISAPRCFEIERRLKAECDIPIFHDDQHGTAVVVSAAVINALKYTGQRFEDCTFVINGAGSAGVAIARLLLKFNPKDLIICDSKGIIGGQGSNSAKLEMAAITNKNKKTGKLADALKNADVFIGVSAPGCLTPEMISGMNKNQIIFALANPIPEIMPDEAKKAGAAVVGTGRSDFPNQINNVLVFPGIFKGALAVRASDINEEMKIAAAKAIAEYISDENLNAENILPSPLDKKVASAVAIAVAEAAVESGVARI